MFNFVFITITALPLLGLWLMERGAWGPDIYQTGYWNGSTAAYAGHLGVLYLAYVATVIVGRRYIGLHLGEVGLPHPIRYSRAQFRSVAYRGAILASVLVLFVMFGGGALSVVLGAIDKGQFRTQVRFSYLAYLSRDFLAPMIGAVVAYVYMRSRPRLEEHLLLGVVLLLVATSGAIWGYRAAAVIGLIPAFVMLIPRVRLHHAIVLLSGTILAIAAAATYFDGLPFDMALRGVTERATVGTANSVWKVWDIAVTAPEAIPAYDATLRSVLGNRVSALLGMAVGGPLDVGNPTDYSTLATLLVKNFSNGVDATSNVTTTVFGEAVIMLGTEWYWLLSIAAGIVTGIVRVTFLHGIVRERPVVAVVAAMYFGDSIFAWLNSGGITVLLLIPYLVNYWIMSRVALWLFSVAARQRVGAVARRQPRGELLQPVTR
jgi:hypothetical protein